MSNERDVILGAVFPSVKAQYVDKETAIREVETARNGYRPWSRQEVRVLKAGLRDGLSYAQIARTLNRTESSIEGKKYRLLEQHKSKNNRYGRVTMRQLKKRVLEYVEEKQPVMRTDLTTNVRGPYERVRHCVNVMVEKGELLKLDKGVAYSPLITPNYTGKRQAPVRTSGKAETQSPKRKVAESEPLVRPAPEPQLFGAGRDLSLLIIAAGIGAAGVWLVMILLAISLIQSWGG